MSAAEAFYLAAIALCALAALTIAIGIVLLACLIRWVHRHDDDPFSDDTEQAITEALVVAHEDVDGIEDYRIVALRRDLELWGRQS